jgi:uncharacterized protein involved in outer membrane biogenesis
MRKLALWAASALALYAILGFLVAPWIVQREIESALTTQLGRQATVQGVRINPFTLSASVRDLAVKEPDGVTVAASFEALDVDVAWSSLFRGGPIIEAVHLVKPYVRIVRLQDGTYGFQDIIDRFAKAPPSPPGPPPKFAVYNITVTDGRMELDDQPQKARHEVTDLQVGVPFVSSLPAEIDILVAPRLSAKVNGTPFEIAGETKPFKDRHEATVRIDIEDLELGKYLEYAPVALRLRIPSGRLNTRLVLSSTAVPGNRLDTLTLSGSAALQRLKVELADGSPLAAVGRLSVELDSVDLLKRRAAIKAIRIESPELDVVRQKDGKLNFQAALPAAQKEAAPKSGPPQAAFAVTIGDLVMSGGQFRFTDRTPGNPVRMALTDVSMTAAGLSSAPDSRGDFKLTARINRASPVEIAGKVNLLAAEPFVDLTASEREIDLQPMSPYSIMYAGYPIASGKLSLKHTIKLEARKLSADNQIHLEQFDFGEKVESPNATDLPVVFAVAVLKDRDGVIDVPFQLSTSLDNPDADHLEAIRNGARDFVATAANRPFAVLGGEELAYLEFAPGSAALDANAEGKLKTLSKALYERPGLKLEVRGQNEQAQATRDWLINNGKLAANRISISEQSVGAATDKAKPTRVDFTLR